jgi:hypothetical protein
MMIVAVRELPMLVSAGRGKRWIRHLHVPIAPPAVADRTPASAAPTRIGPLATFPVAMPASNPAVNCPAAIPQTANNPVEDNLAKILQPEKSPGVICPAAILRVPDNPAGENPIVSRRKRISPAQT